MSRSRRNRRSRSNRRTTNNRQKQRGKRPNKVSRIRRKIFTNRRNPDSRWVTADDVLKNLKEGWYSFWHSVPKGSKFYWRKDKIVGHSSRNTWPS
ncbi:MAG: hypothetical protein COV79_01015 [Parcubacteria group bacterium CG11_big_fil_rev_8_21_14_0_20_41_14]|nr:MAG: hypothetical protein COV79_01015 [Parcubacteria group bacterium CG11_big_fil_rev_8_21_14_0_20_41_14]